MPNREVVTGLFALEEARQQADFVRKVEDVLVAVEALGRAMEHVTHLDELVEGWDGPQRRRVLGGLLPLVGLHLHLELLDHKERIDALRWSEMKQKSKRGSRSKKSSE